jgi:hypothetical protein
MRVANLKIRIGVLAGIALAASSCQTAKKPVPLLPAKSAPTLAASPATTTGAAGQQTERQSEPRPAQPSIKQDQNTSATAAGDNAALSAASTTPDPVGDLVAGVEKDYRAGLDAYQAGRTDAAKQDFDRPSMPCSAAM